MGGFKVVRTVVTVFAVSGHNRGVIQAVAALAVVEHSIDSAMEMNDGFDSEPLTLY